MKKDIHPQYFQKAEVECACGNKITVGATKGKMKVEICSACHPFYTGKKQLVDTAGRAEKFEARRKKAEKAKNKKKKKEKSKSKKKSTAKTKTEKMIKEAQEKLNK